MPVKERGAGARGGDVPKRVIMMRKIVAIMVAELNCCCEVVKGLRVVLRCRVGDVLVVWSWLFGCRHPSPVTYQQAPALQG